MHESFAHPTRMFLRNPMGPDTQAVMRARPMDAVVPVGGCDMAIPVHAHDGCDFDGLVPGRVP